LKLALITSWDDAYDTIAQVTTPVMHLYCLKHGYEFRPYKGKFHLDKERDPSLLTYGDRIKIQIYKDLYKEFDAIAWLDVDCLITNMEVRLDVLLGERPFLWTYGPSGPLSGFTIARCIPLTHLFLHSVQHRAAEDASPQAPGGRSDQDTMRFFMTMPPYDEIARNLVSCKEAGHCFIPERYGWQDYAWLCGWEPTDFVLTFPSIPIMERLELLKHYRKGIYGE
jgi:hypothetical protein